VDWTVDAAVDGFGDDTVPESLAVHRVSRGPIHDQITWNNMPGSGIRVPAEAAAEIERLWALHLGGSKAVPDQAGLTSAKEGWIEQRLARSRYRENGLRDAKIAAAIKASSDGRLRCEVPGCGFCFEEVYGDPGKGFAHVHHLNVLSGSDEPIVTTLADLAIVCANCHAMIHRGGECRPLQGLLKRSK
jgi:predicted HNH restriction endonuclease